MMTWVNEDGREVLSIIDGIVFLCHFVQSLRSRFFEIVIRSVRLPYIRVRFVRQLFVLELICIRQYMAGKKENLF